MASDDVLPDIAVFKRWHAADASKADAWRKEAREDYRLRDGDQWSEEEKAILRDQMRPALTFNRVGVLVDAVVGSEISNRREVRYIPRELGDTKPNELLTSAAEWFRDQTDAEDEESHAFKDAVTAGMGWIETRLDFTDDPAGQPKICRIDPFEMLWDHRASKPNLDDSERRWRARRIGIAEAREMFPDVEDEDLNAAWASGDDEGEPDLIDRRNRYSEERGRDDEGASLREVTVVTCQFYQKEAYYKALLMDPATGQPQMVELDAEKHEMAQKAGAVIQSVKMTRRVVMQAFLGATVLEPPKPTPTRTWTFHCITGLQDQDKGLFYGIVRRARDPQRWQNKWLSQMMHIMNSQAKGGIMAEDGAFEDVREAEQTWTRPDAITKLAKGALQNGKIQPKPTAQFPAGFDRLLQYADEAIVKATGINMELLGMRDATQPGVLEYQRKQAGVSILASFFDALRRYRKEQGRAMLPLIRQLADGRMIRIVGEENAQYVPLMREEISDVEYDIIVDDSPTSTNEKEKTWQLLQAVLPMFKDAIGPKEGLILAEYSPLPSSLVEKLKGLVQQSENAGPPPEQQAAEQQAMMQFQLEQAKMQLEMEKLAVERERLQSEQAIAVIQNETERFRAQLQATASMSRPQDSSAFN